MTDHHDELPDAGDELDRSIIQAMRDEIPAPPTDYWNRVDRTLARIAHESVGENPPTDGSVDSWVGSDTDGAVVRLMDMEPDTTTTRPFGSGLVARAAILLILVGLTAAAAVAAIVASRPDDSVDPARSTENAPATSSSPATPTTGTPTTGQVPPSGAPGTADAIAVGLFTAQDVQDAGWEGIGCWMHPSADLGSDVRFFMGWDGGFVVIDGEPVEMANTAGQSFGNTDDVFVGGGYRAEFVEVGDPTPSSIESTVQDVVLRITADDGRSTDISGVLWCGV